MKVYLLTLALISVSSLASAEPLKGVSPGEPLQSALQKLGPGTLFQVQKDQPQALSRGLLKSGLLEAMNFFKVTPSGGDSLLMAQVVERIALLDQDEARFALAADPQGIVTFAFSRLQVPVDSRDDRSPGDARSRLHRLKDALASMSAYRLRPIQKDARGNRLVWRGQRGRVVLHVRYRPELDELWILASRS